MVNVQDFSGVRYCNDISGSTTSLGEYLKYFFPSFSMKSSSIIQK
jgi:hypothetical protein